MMDNANNGKLMVGKMIASDPGGSIYVSTFRFCELRVTFNKQNNFKS